MSSPNPWTISGIEQASADLAVRVRAHLKALCGTPDEHARFLNMLALMEHIGSRKIVGSQSRGPLDCETLKHLAEEARHAFFFKRAAEKIAGRPMDFSTENTVAAGPAKMYFGRLDSGISRALGDDVAVEVPYLYVSMIIELRAIWAYRMYHEVLTEEGATLSLKSVVAEELLHLPEMAERLAALGEPIEDRVPGFARLEDSLFRGLWRAVESGASVEAVAVH